MAAIDDDSGASRPALPLLSAPPDHVDPSGRIQAWYTHPPGLILQYVRPVYADSSTLAWSVEVFDAALERFPEGDVSVVLDMGLLRGRDRPARDGFVAYAKDHMARVRRAYVVPPRETNPIRLASFKAAVALLSAFGLRVEIADSGAAAVRAAGLFADRAQPG